MHVSKHCFESGYLLSWAHCEVQQMFEFVEVFRFVVIFVKSFSVVFLFGFLVVFCCGVGFFFFWGHVGWWVLIGKSTVSG